MCTSIIFQLNQTITEYSGNPSTRLLQVLRDEYYLTGSKCGCLEGECGACSVLLNGKLVNSCLVAMGSLSGAHVLTIEGYANTEQFHVLSEAYRSESAVQCGFCIPGMVLASACLLAQNSTPTDEEIRTAISGNLCRCTGYQAIVRAIRKASLVEGIDWTIHTSNLWIPITLESAVVTIAYTKAVPYAGGTDLMVQANESIEYLYLGQIAEMREIYLNQDINQHTGGILRIGAAVTFAELIAHPLVPQILKDACREVGAPAIRNMGTIGGNIANGSAKADVALICRLLDASLNLHSIRGVRNLPIVDFYQENKILDLQEDELLVEILLPIRSHTRYFFHKVSARQALAISRISVAACITVFEGRITHFASAFGAITDVILRPYEIDQLFIGLTIREAQEVRLQYLTAMHLFIQPIQGRVSAEYRKDVCMNLLSEALDQLLIEAD